MVWCDQPESTSLGFRSDRTLGHKTWWGFRAVIESLTSQNNTHLTLTLTLLNSSIMSMINSYQFCTPRGDLISIPRGLRPVQHHTGNSTYPASRLVGLWSCVVVDMYHWPLLDCGECLAHCSWRGSLDLSHWSSPWWSTLQFEDPCFPSLRRAEGIYDRWRSSYLVQYLELRYLGSGCNGYSHWCCFLGNPLLGYYGQATLEINKWKCPSGKGGGVSICGGFLTLFI